MDPANPYAPPATPIATPAARRSRWLPLRWFPAALLGTYAAVYLLLSAKIANDRSWFLGDAGGSAGLPRAVVIANAWLVATASLLGVLSLLAAWSWYSCRWKMAAALTILFVGAAVGSIGLPF